VRDSEQVARRIATDKVRKTDLTPELLLLERELTEKLGTRVRIEKKEQGGKVLIDFFSVDDLAHIRSMLAHTQVAHPVPSMKAVAEGDALVAGETPSAAPEEPIKIPEQQKEDDDLYSIKNFSV